MKCNTRRGFGERAFLILRKKCDAVPPNDLSQLCFGTILCDCDLNLLRPLYLSMKSLRHSPPPPFHRQVEKAKSEVAGELLPCDARVMVGLPHIDKKGCHGFSYGEIAMHRYDMECNIFLER